MKRPLIAALGLAALVLLSACQKEVLPPPLEERTAEGIATQPIANGMTGVVSALPAERLNEGTHLLEPDDGSEPVVLKSRTVNLGKYLGGRVTLRGGWEEAFDGRKTFRVDAIESADLGAAGAIKVYEDKVAGIRMEVPAESEWRLEGKEAIFSLAGKDWLAVKTVSDAAGWEKAVPKAIEPEFLTVAGRQARRVESPKTIALYVQKTQTSALLLRLLDRAPEGAEAAFQKTVKSLQLKSPAPGAAVGASCGGPEKIVCPEGYLCELSGPEAGAEGHCTAIPKSSGTCPYVPLPEGCADPRPASFGENGCVTRYGC